jgi:hypothetical protein
MDPAHSMIQHQLTSSSLHQRIPIQVKKQQHILRTVHIISTGGLNHNTGNNNAQYNLEKGVLEAVRMSDTASQSLSHYPTFLG